MKKRIVLAVLIALIMGLCACSSNNNEGATLQTENESTTTERVTSVTALHQDEQKANDLAYAVESYFESGKAVANPDGTFVYENNRDAQTMYAYEREERFEAPAKLNADAFVYLLKDLYPYDIWLESFDAIEIGSGDHGIDSVRYEAVYTNSQNQIIKIIIDSDAVISYIDCTLTW